MSQNKVDFNYVEILIMSLTFQFARIGETTTTVCEAFLPNGFSVGSGKSACVDPANFDFETGCKYAKENAIADAKNNIGQLEGYLLKVTGKTSDCFPVLDTPLSRLKNEHLELTSKINALSTFTDGKQPTFITDEHWGLMANQLHQMNAYCDTLECRMETFNPE